MRFPHQFMTKIKQILHKYPFSVVCFSLVWILSLTPIFPPTPLDNIRLIDKWVHIVMYGGSCIVLWVEYMRHHPVPNVQRLFVGAWLLPVLMGGGLELIQTYCTRTRTGEWLDFLANSLGVTLAAVIGSLVTAIRATRQRDAHEDGNCRNGGRPSPRVPGSPDAQ